MNDNGKVTAKAAGKTTITATCGKLTADCEIVVVDEGEAPDPKPELTNKLILNEHEMEITMADKMPSYEFTVSFDPAEAEVDPSELEWSSSNEDVCRAYFGRLMVIGAGEAYIKVSYEDYEPDSCLVKIYPPVVLLKGFSISASKKAAFSQGNLQYNPGRNIWRFAENQNESVASRGYFIYTDPTKDEWMDSFGFGTGDDPTKTIEDETAYETFTDWGTNKIWNGGDYTWRTMTRDEWLYVATGRPNANTRRAAAKVGMIMGTVLMPDNITSSDFPYEIVTGDNLDEKNYYTLEQWKEIENATGSVFLPQTGSRDLHFGEPVMVNMNNGLYWTNFLEAGHTSSVMQFSYDGAAPNAYYCGLYNGRAVRLITEE